MEVDLYLRSGDAPSEIQVAIDCVHMGARSVKLGRILVATDFSEAGTYAVAEAREWATRYRAALHVVHVVPPKRWFGGIFGSPDSLHNLACEHAAKALKGIADDTDTTRIPHISTGVMAGTAARTIALAARELNADLLIIGARGEHQSDQDQTGLGGTAAKLVHSPVVPVMLVRRKAVATLHAVLAPVDLTPISTYVLQWALRCCHAGELRALHVYEVPFSRRLRAYGVAETAINVYTEDEHAKRARQLADLIKELSPPSTVQIQQIVERGESSESLLQHLRRFSGSTVVLGKHRSESERTGPNYDSVCDYAARFCPTNVLTVPPPAAGD